MIRHIGRIANTTRTHDLGYGFLLTRVFEHFGIVLTRRVAAQIIDEIGIDTLLGCGYEVGEGQSPNRVVDHLFLSNLPSSLKLFLRTMLASRMSSQQSRLPWLRNEPSPPNAMKICLPFSPTLPPAFPLCKRNHPLLPDCIGCSLALLPSYFPLALYSLHDDCNISFFSLSDAFHLYLFLCYCFLMMPKGGSRTIT